LIGAVNIGLFFFCHKLDDLLFAGVHINKNYIIIIPGGAEKYFLERVKSE
jgi:hypothetical protein